MKPQTITLPGPAWEKVAGTEADHTDRLKVDGGYIYRTKVSPQTPGEFAVAMVFVPDLVARALISGDPGAAGYGGVAHSGGAQPRG